jgi:N utilization substance protein A
MVVNEMRGEKIDIVPFSEDLADFVAKALSPAKVTQVIISEDGTAADVIVPDHQLSLAIGREGQNARLSARLTGVRVDIRSETQLAEGIPAGHGRDSDVEYAVGEWRPNAETGENEWHAADGSVISESEWNKQAEEAQAEAEAAAAADAEIPEVLEELKAGPWAGSVLPMSDPDQVPPGYEIKGNEQSEMYHVPGSRYYDATKAELWFRSVDAAEGAGYTPPGGSDDTSDSGIDAPADVEEEAAAAPAEAAEAPAETDEAPAAATEAPADDAEAPAEATEAADDEATSEEDD